MIDPHSPHQNHLINALPADVYHRLFPHLELVKMPLSEVIYESGGELKFAYFPSDCIVSLLYVLENGASAEIAVVGNEGIVGVALFMGSGTMPNRAIVQSAGHAYRLRARGVPAEWGNAPFIVYAIPKPLLPKCRKQRYAIGIIP